MNTTLCYLTPEISRISVTLRRERPHIAVRQVRRISSKRCFRRLGVEQVKSTITMLLTIGLTYISRKKGSRARLYLSPRFEGNEGFLGSESTAPAGCAIISRSVETNVGNCFYGFAISSAPRRKRMRFVSPGTCENAREDLPRHFGVIPARRYTRYRMRSVCMCVHTRCRASLL